MNGMECLCVECLLFKRFFVGCSGVLHQQNAALTNNAEVGCHAGSGADAVIGREANNDQVRDLALSDCGFEVGPDETGIDVFGEDEFAGLRSGVRLEGCIAFGRVQGRARDRGVVTDVENAAWLHSSAKCFQEPDDV